MLVCEHGFDHPDPAQPGYSLHEVDFYAWSARPSTRPSHRLSLRKNLQSNEFEVYRHYNVPVIHHGPSLTSATHLDLGDEEIVASNPNLQPILELANLAVMEAHGHGHGDDLCQHRPPRIDTNWCPESPFQKEARAAQEPTA